MMGYQFQATDNADSSIGIGFQANIAQTRAVGIGNKVNVSTSDAIGIGSKSAVSANQSIAIGAGSNVSGTNSLAIGFGATVSSDNQVFMGNASTTSIGGSVNWTATSDSRMKRDIQENIPGLDFINASRPVTYHYDAQLLRAQFGGPESSEKDNIRYSGFLAQEVEAAAKLIGYEFSGVDAPQNENGVYGIRYSEFVVPLVQAVKELHAKVKAQEAELATNDEVIALYEKTLAEIEARLSNLEKSDAFFSVDAAAQVSNNQ